MDRKETEAAVARLATPFLELKELLLWGVEFYPGPVRSILRVYIEGVDGVDVEDCARVSRHLGAVLEIEDVVRGPFTLEVSSPGLTRTFFTPGQLPDYLGRTIELGLDAPREGRRRFTGILTAVEGDKLSLRVEGRDHAFAWDEIKKVKLVHDFSTPAPSDSGRAKTAPPRTGGKK